MSTRRASGAAHCRPATTHRHTRRIVLALRAPGRPTRAASGSGPFRASVTAPAADGTPGQGSAVTRPRGGSRAQEPSRAATASPGRTPELDPADVLDAAAVLDAEPAPVLDAEPAPVRAEKHRKEPQP
ncbi:hypothetical protein ACIQMR_07865 [Streptomyces sp. NPDC091376]|uniref:hypothetical protein n=1 Tax=Streptomyces sp. NPDC091376 TaxID=3365994 RepID=UPI00380AE8AD